MGSCAYCGTPDDQGCRPGCVSLFRGCDYWKLFKGEPCRDCMMCSALLARNIAEVCGVMSLEHNACILKRGHQGGHRYDPSIRTIPDSPANEVLPGGASRVPVGKDYSQLSHIALELMAETQYEGNQRYGYGNWQKGLPASNLLSHAFSHILALQNGDTSTETVRQHLGHALWNLEKLAHFIYTRPDLIDVEPLKKALGGKSSVMLSYDWGKDGAKKPADPNPHRDALCWFCGSAISENDIKVIPPHNPYRQAHLTCAINISQERRDAFDTPPGVDGGHSTVS